MAENLRALAETVKDQPDVGLRWSDIDWGLTFVPGEVAEYLIAASPDRILALLNENERLRAAAKAVVDVNDAAGQMDARHYINETDRTMDDLRAALERATPAPRELSHGW